MGHKTSILERKLFSHSCRVQISGRRFFSGSCLTNEWGSISVRIHGGLKNTEFAGDCFLEPKQSLKYSLLCICLLSLLVYQMHNQVWNTIKSIICCTYWANISENISDAAIWKSKGFEVMKVIIFLVSPKWIINFFILIEGGGGGGKKQPCRLTPQLFFWFKPFPPGAGVVIWTQGRLASTNLPTIPHISPTTESNCWLVTQPLENQTHLMPH